MQTVFSVCPLSSGEWIAVCKMSIPVVILDETMKYIARTYIDGTTKHTHTMVIEGAILGAAWAIYFGVVLVWFPFY